MEKIDLAKLPRIEAIEYCVKYLGYNSTDAELVVSIARGEVDGDVKPIQYKKFIIDDYEMREAMRDISHHKNYPNNDPDHR